MALTDVEVNLISDGLTTATTAYTAGDCLDNVWTGSGFAAANAGTGWIQSVTLVDDGDVLGAVDLVVLNATISITDNAAFAPADADSDNVLHVIPIPPAFDWGSNRIADASLGGPWPFKCAAGTTALFFALVTRTGNAVFVAVDDVHLRFNVTQTS